VIVNDFDVLGSLWGPAEADAPLIVDANAELALALAFQGFKPIARWRAQELQRCRLRLATLRIDAKRAGLPVSKNFRVSLRLKLFITAAVYNV
jgi:hypothetical protein